MGIQDHIFDVEAALEGHEGASDAFDKLTDYIAHLERDNAAKTRLLSSLKTGASAFKELMADGIDRDTRAYCGGFSDGSV